MGSNAEMLQMPKDMTNMISLSFIFKAKEGVSYTSGLTVILDPLTDFYPLVTLMI